MKAKLMFAAGLLGLMSVQAYAQDAVETASTTEETAATTEATAEEAEGEMAMADDTPCEGLDPSYWNYPEDANTAKEKNAFYSDMVRNEQYAEALGALRWLFNNAPDMNPAIYINGAKIFENIAEAEEDKDLKYAYYDSALWCYDQRVNYWCDEDGKVRDYRAFYLFKFYYRDGTQYPRIMENYNNLYALRGNEMSAINIVPYMTTVARLHDPMNYLPAEDVLEVYDNLSQLIVAQAEAGTISEAKADEYQTTLDQKLAAAVPMDALFIEENFCTKLDEDGTDLNAAKKIVAYSLSNQATDNRCFVDAAKLVYHNDPTTALARLIADKHLGAEEYDSAIVWFQNAIDLIDDNVRKAEFYYNIAGIYRTQGQYSNSRAAAQLGIEQDPTNTKNYVIIGDLYQASFQLCKGGENVVHDRAVYIAAYNWYRKAGDASRMASARAQFPSTQDIFSYNMSEGQSHTVGCWIGETVTIQARP